MYLEYIAINQDIVDKIGEVIKNKFNEIPKLDLFDKRYYPPERDNKEDVVRYFLVLVALDHRLSRPGKPYEACLEDGCYHGADLLYRLGKKVYDYNREFFDPRHLASLTVDEFNKIFSIGRARVPDPEVRVYLLKDLGIKITKLFNGRALELITKSSNLIRGVDTQPGLLDLLRIFRAYEDPVEKKSFLLIKFLIGRRILNPKDPWSLEIPVDNHLTRIALRTGLINVKGRLWKYIKAFKPVTRDDDMLIRLFVRRAYKTISVKYHIDIGVLDDFLWIMGRKICLRDEEPQCDKCLFKKFCRAYRDREYLVKEHNYYTTWYY